MKSSENRFQRCLLLCGLLFAGWLLAGCEHLYYADPNNVSQTPYVFPGQTPAPAQTAGRSPAPPPVLPTGQLPVAAASTVSDILRIGDSITVSFSDIPTGLFPVTQRIRDDGKITLPYNVTVVAAARTIGQLQDDIRQAYVPRYFKELTATVKTEERVFYVEGEVKLPNRLPYLGDMTVLRAITTAGGFTDFGNRKNIELRRATGQKLKINWYKAIEDPRQDPPVYPNDQIIVHKRLM